MNWSSRTRLSSKVSLARPEKPVAAAKAARDGCMRPNDSPLAVQHCSVNYSNLGMDKEGAVRPGVPALAGGRR